MRFFVALLCAALAGCASDPAQNLQPVHLKVRKVVTGDMAYLVSDKGMLKLPDLNTQFEVDYTSLSKMIYYFENHRDRDCTVYVDDNVILGIANGEAYFPPYKTKSKAAYAREPLKLTTTMRRWTADAYGLTINTDYGTFCLASNYEYSDFYQRTYPLLVRCCKQDQELEAEITIYFHMAQDPDECAGEIESIELADTGNQ